MSIYIGYQSSSKSTEIRQNPSVNIDSDIGIRCKGRSAHQHWSISTQCQSATSHIGKLEADAKVDIALLLASAAIGITHA